jgi:hypothetical protein
LNTSRLTTLAIVGLAALLGGCAVYTTTDADRFPCATDADCYSKQPSCQPAFSPNGSPGTFCSACAPNAVMNEYALCTGDSDCRCPLQCLRGPASTESKPELRCFKPCTNSSNNCLSTQTCNLDNDGICVLLP